MADIEQIDSALLAWVRLFPGTENASSLTDLSSGVVLANVLSEMHEDYKIADSDLNKKDNWVLHIDNLNLVIKKLNIVYRRFGSDTVILSDVISPTKIAEEQDIDEIRILCKFMLTSMFASTKADELGNAIMPLQENEETSAVPELLMSIMQTLQQEHLLDPSTIVFKDEYDSPKPEPVPVRTYDPEVFESDEPKKSSMGMIQTAADFEEKIQELQRELHNKNDEIHHIQELNNRLSADRSAMEDKYQTLYDKQFSERSVSPPERSEEKSTRYDRYLFKFILYY